MIAITGATGQLGRLVADRLLALAPGRPFAALVRDTAKAAALTARGVEPRRADYDDTGALDQALRGVDTLLLISANEIGRREAQHRNVINAARRQGVRRIVYTSLLHADTSPLSLAGEHRQTEALLRSSGVAFTILRNGWYTENYAATAVNALASGVFYGAAGGGKIASAARADYAEAAARTLLGNAPSGTVLELAGDTAYTLDELASTIARQTGRPFSYKNLSEPDYKTALLQAGLPEALAGAIAGWDTGATHGALFDDSRHLSRLLGRPTTPLAETVRTLLQA